MTSQPGKQTITIHILPDISRNKGNQAMRFGQLIEFKWGTLFFEKSCAKCNEEARPFLKYQNWALKSWSVKKLISISTVWSFI